MKTDRTHDGFGGAHAEVAHAPKSPVLKKAMRAKRAPNDAHTWKKSLYMEKEPMGAFELFNLIV